MKTIQFTNRPDGYGCSEPGNNAGEYVRADVARGILEALKSLRSDEYRAARHSDSTFAKAYQQAIEGLADLAILKAGDELPPARVVEVTWSNETLPPPGYGPGTNTGHGHAWKRPDGIYAKCLGVHHCKECKRDSAVFAAAIANAEDAK
jgi:hypothetical protein